MAYPEVTAASALALMGAMNFVGTIASGWLTDRYDPRKLLAVYYSLRGLSLLLLPFVTSLPGSRSSPSSSASTTSQPFRRP
jgi:predicted MFS family arabinose efflux permease